MVSMEDLLDGRDVSSSTNVDTKVIAFTCIHDSLKRAKKT